MKRIPSAHPDVFWNHVDQSAGDTACWPWKLSTQSDGYGQCWTGTKNLVAHRVSYMLTIGPVPEGLELDHVCRNRRCVNPAHLEAVTPAENKRRQGAAKTHCPRGHEYTSENTYIGNKGERNCRRCIYLSNRRRRLERAAAR